MSFSKGGGKWLASSGSDAMVLWPFFGGGPMGKAPIELAGGDGVNRTQVACHPKEKMVAGGSRDGLVVIADIGSSRICRSRLLGMGRSRLWPGPRMERGSRSARRTGLPRSSISLKAGVSQDPAGMSQPVSGSIMTVQQRRTR